MELGFGCCERARRLARLDDELDLGSHRTEAMAEKRGGKRVHYREGGGRARKLAVGSASFFAG